MEAFIAVAFVLSLLLFLRWCALPQLRRMNANRQHRKVKHYNKLERSTVSGRLMRAHRDTGRPRGVRLAKPKAIPIAYIVPDGGQATQKRPPL